MRVFGYSLSRSQPARFAALGIRFQNGYQFVYCTSRSHRSHPWLSNTIAPRFLTIRLSRRNTSHDGTGFSTNNCESAFDCKFESIVAPLKIKLPQRIKFQLSYFVHWHHEMPGVIEQRTKAKLEVERLSGIIDCVNFHGSNPNLFGDVQCPPQSINEQERPKPSRTMGSDPVFGLRENSLIAWASPRALVKPFGCCKTFRGRSVLAAGT
jgi:hypothetical protein